MKVLPFVVALLLAIASQPSSADDFAFSIVKPLPLAKLPVVCPIIHAKLGEPTPWSDNICMKRLALHGLGAIWIESEDEAAAAEQKARMRAARIWDQEP